jgi:hypothetical protein
MSERSDVLACLECGEAIPGNRSLVCAARCGAVINLVQYGRTNIRAGSKEGPDQDQLNRLRRKAEVRGHFPTWGVWTKVLERDRECCQYRRCDRRDARMIDWVSDHPVLDRVVRPRDLRTICAQHQEDEAVRRRFVDPHGQVMRTAPAIWARIEAAHPLARRDDASLWASTKNWSLLTRWPLISEAMLRDLHNWSVAVTSGDDGEIAINVALDSLKLPTRRRREHLVRVVNALAVREWADEATPEALQQNPVGGETDHSLLMQIDATDLVMGDPERHVADTDHHRRARLNQRLRQTFIEGAEEDSRRRLGRGLTAKELERVLRHYPGDLPERR